MKDKIYDIMFQFLPVSVGLLITILYNYISFNTNDNKIIAVVLIPLSIFAGLLVSICFKIILIDYESKNRNK